MFLNHKSSRNESAQVDMIDFDYVQISLASPQTIRGWSYGEVTRPETYNYRTQKVEKDGLLCPVIFGPVKNYECLCGKYRRYKYRGIVCEKCGVEVTESRVRRERMGHIDLAIPVVHTWFLYSSPSCIATILDISRKILEQVIYYDSHIVIDGGTTKLSRGQLLSDEELDEAISEYGTDRFKVGIGAGAIYDLLESVDLERERRILMEKTADKVLNTKLVNRLDVITSFLDSNNKPEWMVLRVLPVLPPDLRPCVILEADKLVTSDLNDLYRRIINRNTRLKELISLGAPDIVVRNEKRMLQESIDALFYNEKHGDAVHSNGRPHKSLGEILSGKQGRFRQNLLGKRVDYSGRSVIVVGPSLKLHQCGLPVVMALEMFKPFIYSKLMIYGKAGTIKAAQRMVQTRDPEVFEILQEVVSYHPILLNRAPTLHRLGIQAFEPVLVKHNAIELHPLVCAAFNADFDGDQMAVHIPLSIEAQMEARVLMLSTNNLLSPSSGNAIIAPAQDIVLGVYYITNVAKDAKTNDKVYLGVEQIRYDVEISKIIEVNSLIKYLDVHTAPDGSITSKVYETTPGRVFIFDSINENNGVLDFSEVNQLFTKKLIGELFDKIYQRFEKNVLVDFADSIKELGFKWSTKAAISIGKGDMIIPETKWKLIDETKQKVDQFQSEFADGYITEREKYNKIVDAWYDCTSKVTADMVKCFQKDSDTKSINSIYMMAHSGARGSITQIKQLSSMRGLMSKTNGEVIETPVLSNFKEGLTPVEYFTSAHGARKGLADTALKTADAGYLTRKLVDAVQNCVVNQNDCGTEEGILYVNRYDGINLIQHVSEIVEGRILTKDLIARDGTLVGKKGELVCQKIKKLIEEKDITEVEARSPILCKLRYGVCQKCYGSDVVTKKMVELGQAVGIIAAQSIGEPGTQLTMRTFHIGGVSASKSLEKPFINADSDGVISFSGMKTVTNKNGDIFVVSHTAKITLKDSTGKIYTYKLQYSAKLKCKDGQSVANGDVLAEIDIYNIPVIAEYSGTIVYSDLVQGISYRKVENTETGRVDNVLIASKLHPGVKIRLKNGQIASNAAGNNVIYYLTPQSTILVQDNAEVLEGDILAYLPKVAQRTKDITGGLPRVVSMFEARVPSTTEVVSPCNGYIVDVKVYKSKKKIVLQPADGSDQIEFSVPSSSHISVYSGSEVGIGDVLVLGEKNPHDILIVQGVCAFVLHMLEEIQGVYEIQGVKINHKHIEVVLRYMARKGKIYDAGDSRYFIGQKVDLNDLRSSIEELEKAGKKVPHFKPILEGITRAASTSDSFISRASFQETVKALSFAAIKEQRDDLVGIKENVVLGRLIPAGTGFSLLYYKKSSKKVEGVSETSEA